MQKPVAVITGASSGIGAALARTYAARDYRLALLARRMERLEEVKSTCQALKPGTDVLLLPADVTNPESLAQAFSRIRSHFGRMDVVIANAGFGVRGRIDRLSVDDFRRQFETNVFGVLNTVLPVLGDIKSSQGRLAIVGSVNSFVANEGAGAYAMSKHAVRALSEVLHIELSDFGASCTLIAPGFVESEIQQVDNHGALKLHKHAPPPSWLVMKADTAARVMARAIACRRREIIVTGHGKVFVFLARHFSGFLGWFQIALKPIVKKFIKSKQQ